jgi:hypothetical protein
LVTGEIEKSAHAVVIAGRIRKRVFLVN